MTPRTKRPAGKQPRDAADDFAAFLRDLDHPLRRDLDAVRAIVLGSSPAIREGVKWNSISFRTTEWFATVNLRSRDAVQLVFHLGAKVKDGTASVALADPAGMVRWLAKDRCLVTVGAGKAIAARRTALTKIVRAWLRHVV